MKNSRQSIVPSRAAPLRMFPLLLLLSSSGCGGGGGGGGGADNRMLAAPAIAAISASPIRFDSGTRTRVTVTLREVAADHLLVKLRYPKGLALVRGSATWNMAENTVAIDPTVATWDDTKGAFLAFAVGADDFGREDEGTISFLLRGTQALPDGEIEVDVDYNDLAIPDNQEFTPASPLFSTEDAVQVTVLDDSGAAPPSAVASPTPNATASPAATP